MTMLLLLLACHGPDWDRGWEDGCGVAERTYLGQEALYCPSYVSFDEGLNWPAIPDSVEDPYAYQHGYWAGAEECWNYDCSTPGS